MNSHFIYSVVMCVALVAGHSVAAARDQKSVILSCFNAEFSELVSAMSREYSSPQFYIACQFHDIDKRERNKTFTYFPPEGFRIVSADVSVVLKSSQTSIQDLTFQGQHATINLQCKGRPDDVLVHDAVAVKLVGHLEYLPTPQETKNIVKLCLDKVLPR